MTQEQAKLAVETLYSAISLGAKSEQINQAYKTALSFCEQAVILPEEPVETEQAISENPGSPPNDQNEDPDSPPNDQSDDENANGGAGSL